MDQSLSVVLPVFNAQATLRQQVHDLLEVLPDLTPDFELLIIDDGSSDQTEEIARELAREYPQLRVSRHPWRLGAERALKTGLEASQGEIVFVQDDRAPVSPGDLRRLWALRKENDVIMARPEPRRQTIHPKLMQRLIGWGQALTASTSQAAGQGGIQMIRRSALRELEPAATDSKRTTISLVARSDVGGTLGPEPPKFIDRVNQMAARQFFVE